MGLFSDIFLYIFLPLNVITENRSTAQEAARKVKITYKDVKTPILTVEDAINNNSYFPVPGRDVKKGDTESKSITLWCPCNFIFF